MQNSSVGGIGLPSDQVWSNPLYKLGAPIAI